LVGAISLSVVVKIRRLPLIVTLGDIQLESSARFCGGDSLAEGDGGVVKMVVGVVVPAGAIQPTNITAMKRAENEISGIECFVTIIHLSG
jgi:hypothetical protein